MVALAYHRASIGHWAGGVPVRFFCGNSAFRFAVRRLLDSKARISAFPVQLRFSYTLLLLICLLPMMGGLFLVTYDQDVRSQHIWLLPVGSLLVLAAVESVWNDHDRSTLSNFLLSPIDFHPDRSVGDARVVCVPSPPKFAHGT